LQLLGYKDPWDYFIVGNLISNINRQDIPIKFLISITAENTIISYKDALNIGLELDKLNDK